MVFINCIAEYVHTAVADNGGFPNKNIGATPQTHKPST